MIATLPTREIQQAQAEQRRLQPRNPFSFLWNEFFAGRKFKLTGAEVRELQDAEASVQPWRDMTGRLWAIARDPEAHLWETIGKLKATPTQEALQDFLMARHASPAFGVQTEKAIGELQGAADEKLAAAVVPLVRKHLTRIHDSLCAEYAEQEAADKKALARLDGVATGGESQACIEIRVQADRIRGLLDGGNLTDWRAALGPFLP